MADTNISGIAKIVLSARADMKATKPENDREGVDFSASFMDMMKQNTPGNSVSQTTKASSDSIQPVKTDDSPVYDVSTSKQANVTVKEEITAEKVQTEGAEKLDEFAENVYETLEEEYHVSKEDIEAVLASLGFNVTDLMDPKNLMTLVTELTGEDVGTLFLSENFQNVMQEISVLTEELAAEFGITKEQLMAFAKELNQKVKDAAVATDTFSSQEIETETENIVTVEGEKNIQTLTASDFVREIGQMEDSMTVEEPEEAEEEQPGQIAVTETEEEDTEKSSWNSKNDNAFESGKNSKAEHDGSNAHVTNLQNNRMEEFAIPKETAVPVYTSQVNVADIIEQIANHVRINLSAEGTSMEMQLNPENLGKIYLNISEKEGVIRAQIAAQNEMVKEALETQMVELRQNLNQQGIKVDAIEVTVATHEFEQNLEGQARQEEQARQQMEENQKKARRSLNLNDLDGLTGLMSEEEELVAKMMRDNGNQVDLTA
ncbi:MAG: flagellar hook-length control protein FliK [Roseburia sp.]|nr:flagellar hook-length control protein FliK [Roseburia sp.]